MSSSFRTLHGHDSVFARFSARDSDICTCYFNDIKISMFWYQPHCWETRKNWVMPMKYSKTRRHYLEHVWKLVGGVVPNTPPGGPELEHFTSVEGHRSNLSGNDCTSRNFELRIAVKMLDSFQGRQDLIVSFSARIWLPLFKVYKERRDAAGTISRHIINTHS